MSLKSSTKVDVNTQELIFTVDGETFAAAIDKVFQRQKKNIQVPGFRKGKATKKLIEKYYGEGVFFEDAINSLINDEMPDAIRESELVLVDTPKIEVVSADTENGVEYKAICILKPEVTVPEYKGLKAPKNVKDITEDDIKAQIEQIRQRNARIVSVDDRPAQKDDEVIIDFEGFMDGVAFDGGKADEFTCRKNRTVIFAVFQRVDNCNGKRTKRVGRYCNCRNFMMNKGTVLKGYIKDYGGKS